MDTLIALYPALKALWAAWFALVFLGMLASVLRPSKRKDYERAGAIPLRDDAPRGGGTGGAG